MKQLDEIKNTLWLYSTRQQHPFQDYEAFAALKDHGDLVIDGLIWALKQDDFDLKLLALSLFQEFYPDAKRAIPTLRAQISDAEDALVRAYTISTLYAMGDTGEVLIPLLTPCLDSENNFERVISAASLWRICRSEDAFVVLRREAARVEWRAEIVKGFFDDVEFPIRPEAGGDREAIRQVHQAAFGGNAEANLVDALRDGGFVEVSLVAETEGRVIAHILFSRVEIITKVGTVDALSLAPMAVMPEHQRKGIGTRLVWKGIAACARLSHRIALVLGHPKFYDEFAFSADLARPLKSPFGGGESWMALQLWPNSLKGVEGRVEFSPPFRALE